MNKVEKEILENIRKLKKFESDFLKMEYELNTPTDKEDFLPYFKNKLNLSSEAYKLRHKICFDSQDIDILQISDDDAKKVLRLIRGDNDKFYSVSFYKNLLVSLNKDAKESDQLPTDLYDQLVDDDRLLDFHSWFDMIGFYIRRIKVGPIIASSQISEKVRDYFHEIRQTYAFRQFRSSVALCRSLLEMTLFDKLKRRKLLPSKNYTAVSIKDYTDELLIRLISIAKRENIITESLCDKSHDIRKIANKILHAKEEVIKLSENEVLKVIHDTIEVVEYLHR